MLHYYFRSKENLFEIVFRHKVELLANSFFSVANTEKTFIKMIGAAIEQHFEFIKNNPKLIIFIISEINNNKISATLWHEIATPIFGRIISVLKLKIEEEVSAGSIRNTDPLNLIVTALSLNIFPFMALPLINAIKSFSPSELDVFLELRKKENIRLIEFAIKP